MFTQKVEENDFYDLIGIAKQQGVKMADAVKNSPVLYAERAVAEKGLDEITADFAEYINGLDEDTRERVKEYLGNEISSVDEYLELLKSIHSIEQIIREQKHGFDYNIPRPPISQDDLGAKKEEILKDFNNDENEFWNDRKK